MDNFWIAFIIFFFIPGVFFGAMAYGLMEYQSFVKRFIVGWLTAVITGVVIGGIFTASYNFDVKKFNNGYCPTCEEPWRFAGASRDKSTTYYYWTCDTCGTTIELTNNLERDGDYND